MAQKLQIPDKSAIINSRRVAEVMQKNAKGGRKSLFRLLIKGSVDGYHPDQDRNLLSNPIASSSTTRSSVPYVDLSDGTHTYRAWRTGKIEPQGSAPPLREYPPIAQYLLYNRWPFPNTIFVAPSIDTSRDGNTVVVNISKATSGVTSISPRNVTYYTTSGSTDFSVNADYIRSDETLRLLVAVDAGDDTLSADLKKQHSDGTTSTIASASKSLNVAQWNIRVLEMSPNSRIRYGHDPLVLNVDAGGLTYARPVLRPKRRSVAPSYFSLPDGRALVHVSEGRGWTTGGDPISLSETTLTTDLAAGRSFVFADTWPVASKERAIVTGEDRSQTHQIERSMQPRISTAESLPSYDHLPIARLSAQ